MRERRFLMLTLGLIILVGAPAVFSMIQEPNKTRHSAEMSSISSRSPASISQREPVKSEPTGRNAIKAKSITVDFDCSKKRNPNQEIDGNLLRLKSSACLNDKMKNISIVNKTNGFTAAVIFVKQGFTTDFIDLAEGENILAIRGIDERGQSFEQVLNVKRRAPASL